MTLTSPTTTTASDWFVIVRDEPPHTMNDSTRMTSRPLTTQVWAAVLRNSSMGAETSLQCGGHWPKRIRSLKQTKQEMKGCLPQIAHAHGIVGRSRSPGFQRLLPAHCDARVRSPVRLPTRRARAVQSMSDSLAGNRNLSVRLCRIRLGTVVLLQGKGRF
ncbi:hypothetical protein D9M70_562080 [compost metagenome]